MTEPHYARNRSQVEDVRDHLFACDAAFVPSLGTRVLIPDYAAKLVVQAERFEAWKGSALIGLVAVYCNAIDRREAFVTNASVVPGQTRLGIGRRLMLEAITHTRCLSFIRVSLFVNRTASALRVYRDLGFQIERIDGETLLLILNLHEKAAK